MEFELRLMMTVEGIEYFVTAYGDSEDGIFLSVINLTDDSPVTEALYSVAELSIAAALDDFDGDVPVLH